MPKAVLQDSRQSKGMGKQKSIRDSNCDCWNREKLVQFTLFIVAVPEVPSLLMRFESKLPLRVPSFWISKE